MLGFFSGLTDLVDEESLKKAISDSVPKGTIDLNLKAFYKGRDYARSLVEGSAAVRARS
jgi:Pyruvate/2-oxoacid:ferredoxin oxidoreductase gamma subunit